MHELTLSRTILDIIKQHASAMNCRSVKKIYLEIGQLIGVDQESLKFSFNVIAKGSIAESAELELIEIKGKAICDFCEEAVMLKNYYDGCAICGRYSLRIIQGEELRVKSMEVE
ncbi:hydrogenase maturation nickel metallochaperone HypA [Legionella micdadei]|uniref:Hydrogenase maturation factor HypA n=1 Tax=Legionella micdadei TaxID=451 RepID=A0A098GGX3_LEGMI|nr:hydrogenase maturation nickel metallochaperone HypA [Legionella micdadei]ARG97686.1 hydrogenase maturation nickel metallochaperone HypA [Legionella micdadei]ARH00001.1 hydrogenase maturation nickel metallochaperone HypA [Legionella micdadei]KTD27777.1 hydrogenase nickel incorporation protein HypA [Legionella micdadei]NSL17762.1 hydrogenase maturation nickel metallochaperone HypA [Legionella micdadei]CEG60736.1 putative hydrogenase nickel incorporation protein hypA [Legionella micdadei]